MIVSHPINWFYLEGDFGLSPNNYILGQKLRPTEEQFERLKHRLSVLFIRGVLPHLTDAEASAFVNQVNTYEWVRQNGANFISNTRLVDQVIAEEGADGLRSLLGDGFEWVYTQKDLTSDMNSQLGYTPHIRQNNQANQPLIRSSRKTTFERVVNQGYDLTATIARLILPISF